MRLHPLFVSSMLLASAPAQQPPAADEAGFDAGVTAMQNLMQRGKWAEARAALLALLAAHPQRPYVQARATALVADFTQCSFHATAVVPKARDLIAGKVISLDEKSGKIKVVYSHPFADWEGETLLVGPMVFAGSYTMTVSGSTYPSADSSLRIAFDMDPSGDGFHIVDCGMASQQHGNHVVWRTANVVYRRAGDAEDAEPQTLVEGKSPAKPGQPFVVVLKVGTDRVDVSFDKKPLLSTKRAKTDLGQVGVWKDTVQEIVIDGRVEPAWLQGRIDVEMGKQREAFAARFDAKKELPGWLFEKPRLVRTQPKAEGWVAGVGQYVDSKLGAVLEQIGAGKLAEAKQALAGLDDAVAPAVSRTFLLAVIAQREGNPEAAEAMCATMLAADPTLTQVRLLRADALEETGRAAEALVELEAARQADPGYFPVHEQLVVHLMRRNRAEQARRVVREAKLGHGLWDEVAQLETMLVMAERGPEWPRRFVHRSPHYEVASDIDAKVCADACRILEASRVNLMGQMAWLKDDPSLPPFRVFLFSGESGYQQYNKVILGERVSHTAGLYTPVLKQLLIWNLPRREDMERTIRHEGFHQFLDRVMDNPPIWLNEGTAEFWETAARKDGKLTGGQLRRDHVATLLRSKAALPSLQAFVYGGRGDFYASAQQRYAQAWALVHLLRKGPATYSARFDRLWAELRSAKSTRAALDAAFAGIDWQQFERDFWAHLASLR